MTDLAARGVTDAVVWDPQHTSVGGTHAIFLVRGDVRAFNLPLNPEVPTRLLGAAWRAAALGAGLIVAIVGLALR